MIRSRTAFATLVIIATILPGVALAATTVPLPPSSLPAALAREACDRPVAYVVLRETRLRGSSTEYAAGRDRDARLGYVVSGETSSRGPTAADGRYTLVVSPGSLEMEGRGERTTDCKP